MNRIVGFAPPASICSVLIVDDHPLFSDALASTLSNVFPGCRIDVAGTLMDGMTQLEKGLVPDLVLFDLKLPDVSGISGFVQLRSRLPDVPILVISSLASVEIVHSVLEEGAAGFLPKDTSADRLMDVLSRIAAGQRHIPSEYRSAPGAATKKPCETSLHPKLEALTPQQKKIVRLICAGKPNKQIAYELCLAEATVKAHITALLRRLELRNRTQVAVFVETARSEARGEDPEISAFLNH